MARSYGFRNIQNITRQLKSPKGSAYDFVEVMACPSGCVNGGGQIRTGMCVCLSVCLFVCGWVGACMYGCVGVWVWVCIKYKVSGT